MDKWGRILNDVIDTTYEEKDVVKLQASIMSQIDFLADVTGSTFDDILDSMRRTHDMVRAIQS